ncbi:hypothetical protein CCHR01_16945 [Colletotrichum chrysophilum]|uniref:Uncharacterized protein n=1 Tax=Colletotrichum chrysophilum TaxID=1836956 RepID=A0AAD9A3K1_9PEZI|nr:hypothetical protein CCHR01_16945 [Colletotrichum chrysophilum]
MPYVPRYALPIYTVQCGPARWISHPDVVCSLGCRRYGSSGTAAPPTFPMGSAPCVGEATANEAISLRAPRSFDDTAMTKITGQYPIHAPSPLTEHQTINTSITSCREISSTVRPLPVPLAVESPLDSVTFHPRSRPWTLSRTLSSDASRAVDLRLMRANCCASTVIPRPSPSTFDGSVGAPLTKETLGMRRCTTAEGLGKIRRFAQNGCLVRTPSPRPNRAIPSSTLHVPFAAPVPLRSAPVSRKWTAAATLAGSAPSVSSAVRCRDKLPARHASTSQSLRRAHTASAANTNITRQSSGRSRPRIAANRSNCQTECRPCRPIPVRDLRLITLSTQV